MMNKTFTVSGALAPLMKVKSNLEAVVAKRSARADLTSKKIESLEEQVTADNAEHDMAVRVLINLELLLNPDSELAAPTPTEAE